MPITVNCKCGKSMQVRDEWAGRMGKCPACKQPVQVPNPEVNDEEEEIIAAEVLDDDRPSRGSSKSASKAIRRRQVEDDDIDEVMEVEPVEDDEEPPPRKSRSRPKLERDDDDRPPPRRYAEDDEDEDRPPPRRYADDEDDDRPPRGKNGRRIVNKTEAEKQGGGFGSTDAGIWGGLLMMILALVWFFGALIYADRIYFYPPVLFVLGLIAFIKGLMNR